MATQNDWQEYFELMNDRKPSQDEINAAIASGEIDAPVTTDTTEIPAQTAEEAPVQEETVEVVEAPAEEVVETPETVVAPTQTTEIPVQPTTQIPVQEPVVDQTQQMMQMQQMMQAQQAQQAQQMAQMQAQQAQPSAASSFMNDFVAWAKSVFSKPDPDIVETKTHQFELYTMIANAVVIGLMAIISTSRVYSSFFNFANVFDSFSPSYSTINPGISIQIFIVVSLAAMCATMAVVVATWTVRRGIYRDASVTFNRALDIIGRPMVIIFALNVVAFAAMLLSIYGLFSLLFIVGISLFGFINIYTLFTSKNYTTMNNFYVTLIATVVNGLVISVIFWLTSALFLSSAFMY